MKYYRLDDDIIEFARDFIKDVLPLKYLDKINRELNISCEVAFVDDTGNYRCDQFKELLERLLLGLMSRANYTDSWNREYFIKGENEPRYQVLSPLNENKLEEYIDTYLNNESEVLASSYFFFDAVPADIESIKVIDNTKYRGLKAYDDNNNEINIRIDNISVIKNSLQYIRTVV
jgi:hypothetical protein